MVSLSARFFMFIMRRMNLKPGEEIDIAYERKKIEKDVFLFMMPIGVKVEQIKRNINGRFKRN